MLSNCLSQTQQLQLLELHIPKPILTKLCSSNNSQTPNNQLTYRCCIIILGVMSFKGSNYNKVCLTMNYNLRNSKSHNVSYHNKQFYKKLSTQQYFQTSKAQNAKICYSLQERFEINCKSMQRSNQIFEYQKYQNLEYVKLTFKTVANNCDCIDLLQNQFRFNVMILILIRILANIHQRILHMRVK